MDGDGTGPNRQRTVRFASFSRGIWQIAVFDNVQLSVDENHVANAIFGVLLPNDLGGEFRFAQNMVPDEFLTANVDDRIVDLEIEDFLDSSVFKFGKNTVFANRWDRRIGLRRIDRREHAAVSVGASGDLRLAG